MCSKNNYAFYCSIVKGEEKFYLSTNMATSADETIVDASLINNEDSSSDESSHKEITMFVPLFAEEIARGSRGAAVRMPGYFETVVPRYSGKAFKSHFRLHRESFEKLSILLSTFTFVNKLDCRGRPHVPLPK